MSPKQFKGGAQPRTHFDRQVRQVGGTSYVAMGRILPKTWRYVRMRKTHQTLDKIIVSFEKLYEEPKHAQATKSGKSSKQNTRRIGTANRNKSTGGEK